MEDTTESSPYAILYVDDEENSLKYFQRAYNKHFKIYTATNAQDGFAILREHKDEIGVIITDQRMPGEKGVQLLERARKLRPRVVRILATAYADINAAVEAVNTGAIYQYVTKPWNVPDLEAILRRAMEFFTVQQERDQLMREKLSMIHKLMITDRVISLGILAAGLGHYVRNALVAVRTFLDLAPAKLQDEMINFDELRNPSYWTDFYAHVQIQVARISELLTDLNVACEEPLESPTHKVNLAEVVNGAIARMEPHLRPRDISVENKIPADLPAITVDQQRFPRLFDLLLKDEAINLPTGSAICMTGTLNDDGGSSGPEIQIVLSDNGPGLPDDALRSVFDPFFLRNDDQQEFGINLMAVYFIVYHHGGKIDAQTGDNGGAIFTINLPVNPPEPSGADDEQEFLAKVLTNERLWERLLAGN